jgi:hypothetical protein
MKKIVSLFLIGILSITLIGCNGTGSNDAENNNNKTKEEQNKSADFINDNDSYFIIIDGKKFSAGDNIIDLSDVGYNLRESEASEQVPANKFLIGAGSMRDSENNSIFSVVPFNPTASSVMLSNAVIGGIELNVFATRYNDKVENIEVYGGVKLGFTEEELKEVFGEPSNINTGDNYSVYRYNSDETYRHYKFRFDEEGKVSSIEWQNIVF